MYITTEKGERLSTAHKSYDNADILQTQHELLKTCTLEEIAIRMNFALPKSQVIEAFHSLDELVFKVKTVSPELTLA